MVHSIKTEIIYYGIPTDFEFEFNLCGCCQMRLLTDTASDNASLLKSLQRSISRSRVIIIVGTVTGDDSIISLVSKAIGYDCEILDHNVFQVNSDENIEIIKNSVPLITDDGTFGGCIIESGPQSMIFLSEERKIRKNIMNTLVHPYLADLSKYPTQAIAVSDESIEIEDAQETPNTEILSEEITDVTVEQNSISENVDIAAGTTEVPENPVVDENTTPAPIMEFEDFSTHSTEKTPEHDVFNIDNLTSVNNVDIDKAEDAFSEDEADDAYYSRKEREGAGRRLNILTLILSIILLLLLIFIVYGFVYLPLQNGISVTDNFKNVFGFLKGN